MLKNCGRRNTRETSLAKWHATEHAVKAALDASQLHTLIQADYALAYREDRPIRCEPWPAQGWEREPG